MSPAHGKAKSGAVWTALKTLIYSNYIIKKIMGYKFIEIFDNIVVLNFVVSGSSIGLSSIVEIGTALKKNEIVICISHLYIKSHNYNVNNNAVY